MTLDPDDPSVLEAQGRALMNSALAEGDANKLGIAIDLLERSLASAPPGEPTASRLTMLDYALRVRSALTNSASDLDRSVMFGEQAVAAAPTDDPFRPGILANHANALMSRFKRDGTAADLDRAITMFEEAVATTPRDHEYRPGLLSNLGAALRERFDRDGDPADLDRGVRLGMEAVADAAFNPDRGNGAELASATPGADLEGAIFVRADLTGAGVTGAYLRKAIFGDSILAGAYLTRAILTGAFLTGTNLAGTGRDSPDGESGSAVT